MGRSISTPDVFSFFSLLCDGTSKKASAWGQKSIYGCLKVHPSGIFKIVGSLHKWRRVADGDINADGGDIDADVVLEADCDVGADVADDADDGGEADGENWKQGGPALQLQPHGAEI